MVHLPLPDIKGREEILDLYLRDKPLSAEVEAKFLAKGACCGGSCSRLGGRGGGSCSAGGGGAGGTS